MRTVQMQRYTYYFILGVMAYLSLAYYIHFRVHGPSVYDVINTNNRDPGNFEASLLSNKYKENRRVTALKKSSDVINPGDYSNYYGMDYTVSEDDSSMDVKENKTEFINFDGIKFKSVEFQQIHHIYVYAAFLDNRIDSVMFVRIFALQRKNSLESLLCHFVDSANGHVVTVHTEKYEMCENHGKRYGGHIYSCAVPSSVEITAENISLSTYSTYLEKHPHYLNIDLISLQHNTNLDIGRMFLGVCLPPIFGHIALNILVQYIELTKILGGSKILFYKYNVSQNVEKLLKYYSARGDIEVLEWNLPDDVRENDIWYNGQLLAIQDCLYRNMGRFQFLLFADLDELLIPRHANNWITMLHNIAMELTTNLSSVAGFSFQSVFFDPKQVPDPNQTLRFLQQLDRTQIPSSVRTKLLVQPSQVFELGIHHMSKPIRENLTVINVNPNDSLLHHYRKCVTMFDANMRCYPVVRDTTILKYSTLLKKRTSSVMSHISRLIR